MGYGFLLRIDYVHRASENTACLCITLMRRSQRAPNLVNPMATLRILRILNGQLKMPSMGAGNNCQGDVGLITKYLKLQGKLRKATAAYEQVCSAGMKVMSPGLL